MKNCKEVLADGLGYYAASQVLSYCAMQCEHHAADNEHYELANGFLNLQNVLNSLKPEDDYLLEDDTVAVIADMLVYAFDIGVNGVQIHKCGRQDIISYCNFYIVL